MDASKYLSKEMPDKIGWVVGYKQVEFATPHFLQSSSGGHIWEPLVPITASSNICAGRNWKEAHEAPGEGCTCGIYAYKDMRFVLTHESYIGMRLALWGVVYEHTEGYRAQFAYPLDLYTCHAPYTEALKRYGVPVHLVEKKVYPREERATQQRTAITTEQFIEGKLKQISYSKGKIADWQCTIANHEKRINAAITAIAKRLPRHERLALLEALGVATEEQP